MVRLMSLEANQPTPTESETKHNVVVTGFGLFRDHQINPSWEAIKDGQLKIHRPNVNIITKRVNVSYEEVDKVVPALWEEYQPLLMVHIGLAAHDPNVRLEQFARHGPYIHYDVVKHAPHEELRVYDETCCLEENLVKRNYSCNPSAFDCSTTCIDVERVCEKMNKAYEEGKLKLATKKSLDAGLYVCEYIYHKSLAISDRSIFIHVPGTDTASLENIREAIQFAIEALVDELLSCRNAQFNKS